MSDEKLIYLNTEDTERKLAEAMPVISAPGSLSAEAVAAELEKRKRAKGRISLRGYVSAAAAAVLVLVIGAAGIHGLRSGLIMNKSAMSPDAAENVTDSVKEYTVPSGETGKDAYSEAPAYSVGPQSTGENDPYRADDADGENYSVILDGVAYEGKWEEAVLLDDGSAGEYLESEYHVSEIEGAGENDTFFMLKDGGGALCAVTEAADGSRYILFIRPSGE